MQKKTGEIGEKGQLLKLKVAIGRKAMAGNRLKNACHGQHKTSKKCIHPNLIHIGKCICS